MNKLSLDALKERAEAVASQDLLNSISGGTENACHDSKPSRRAGISKGILSKIIDMYGL